MEKNKLMRRILKGSIGIIGMALFLMSAFAQPGNGEMRALGEDELDSIIGGINCTECVDRTFRVSNSFTPPLCKGYYQYWEGDCTMSGDPANCPDDYYANLAYCVEWFRLFSMAATNTPWTYCQSNGPNWSCSGGTIIYRGYGTYDCNGT